MNSIIPDIDLTSVPWKSVDPLGEALHYLHMSSAFYTRSEFTAPWGLSLPAFPSCLMFHVVINGRCWLEVEGADPYLLQPGVLALVPHGDGHLLLSEPNVPAEKLFDLPREEISDRYEIIRHGQGGEPSTLICGTVRFDHPSAHELIRLLPRLICVDVWQSPQMEWIQSTLKLMAFEAKTMRPGGETIITRLADILVIQTIRSWMANDSQAKTGWLAALQDKQIGSAILLVHRDPVRRWTVESLANEVAMSRSAFAARFKKLVGESPMQYIARWRMNLALTALKNENHSLCELAHRLGYQSEAAFSRTFKRIMGFSPGSTRMKRNNT
ncbi:AraC family transcriptional regulator [uncultured Desulfobacter sp.]|uniref:AraC family transcriptional regulator n=1 Tax=uncultured Desulfobacter sp. TaxID=240139 RepID=UPI002AAB9E9B|nr:AraC family transcriptional regulator [uncultured Desulfobacter sp.]